MPYAACVLNIKAIDDEQRVIEGIASTPTADLGGDVMEPGGAQFKLPLPLLWFHNQQAPVGDVIAASVQPDGIYCKAQFKQIDEPGPLKTRLDEAWQAVKHGLVRGLSIGWKPIEAVPVKHATGFGLHVKKWQWFELSAVTLPQNQDATILNIKSAAFGPHLPGVSGPFPVVRLHKDRPPMGPSVTEQISAFENTRAAKAARMTDIMTKAAETGSTLDAAQTEEYDTLQRDVESVDAHLVRLRLLEKSQIATATPVTATSTAAVVRSGSTTPVISVKANLPPATAFVRFCQAMLVNQGNYIQAAEYAKRWHDSTPEVELCLKAAVNPGTTTDATWAGPLAITQPLASEFIALLRPMTFLGKVPGLRQVPFNVSIPAQTGGGTYQWVGQNAPKPVGSLAFTTVTLGITKCAGIIVITDELARTSSPSAEAVIRQDMLNGIAAFLDAEFTDPTKAPVAGVSPGSITNGVTPITTAGTTPANARTDLQALISAMVTAGISVAGAVLLMSETNAAALSHSLNALGQALYPGLTATGGTALGITVLASQTVGNNVILFSPPNILYADDGGVTIDVSREASVQMNNAPDNPPTAATPLVSFWQQNLVGLRAERYINWKRARTGAVQYTVATYTI